MAQVADQPDTTTRSDPSIICPTLHHYGIRTTQPDVLVDWYGKVVGVECNLASGNSFGDDPDSPSGMWVSNDGAHHRIAIVKLPGLIAQSAEEKAPLARVEHSAWEYDTIAELMVSYKRVRDLGIRPVVCTHHGTSIAYYYRDPDDNVVELLADGFGDWARSREYMRTSDEMRANPMGPAIDPDRMLAAYEEGASDEELSTRAFAGEFTPDVIPDPRVLL